jgi:hypothetical protein
MNRWVRVGVGVVSLSALATVAWLLTPSRNSRPAVALTAVLVGVTAWYAERTHAMVGEMRAARRAQVQPLVAPSLKRIGGDGLLPRVVNAGTGPAINVGVEVQLVPDGPSARYFMPMLPPGRGETFVLTDPQTQEIIYDADRLRPYTGLTVRGTCENALGEIVEVDRRMDIEPYLDGFESGLWGARISREVTGQDPMEGVVETLREIEGHLRSLAEPD